MRGLLRVWYSLQRPYYLANSNGIETGSRGRNITAGTALLRPQRRGPCRPIIVSLRPQSTALVALWRGGKTLFWNWVCAVNTAILLTKRLLKKRCGNMNYSTYFNCIFNGFIRFNKRSRMT